MYQSGSYNNVIFYLVPNSTRYTSCHFRAPKGIDFQGLKRNRFSGPTLPMTLEMDLPSSKLLRPAPCKQQVHFNSYPVLSMWLMFHVFASIKLRRCLYLHTKIYRVYIHSIEGQIMFIPFKLYRNYM
jgi:hypothetical protein